MKISCIISVLNDKNNINNKYIIKIFELKKIINCNCFKKRKIKMLNIYLYNFCKCLTK